MAVVTINGQIGTAVEVGQSVARELGADYVDRQVLVEAARRIGTTEAVLDTKESSRGAFGERVRDRLRKAFADASEVGWTAGFLGGYWDAYMERPYPEAEARLPAPATSWVDDRLLVRVIGEVIRDLAGKGNMVVVGRASNLVLRDHPGALHVGTYAPLPFRTETLMQREGLERREAELYAIRQEEARAAFYRRFFKEEPLDRLLFGLLLNVGDLGITRAASVIANAALRP